MEFLFYLDPIGLLFYYLVSRKVDVVENANACEHQEIYGWLDDHSRTLIMCTENIKRSQPLLFWYYVRETLLHESVHVAQSCKSFNGELTQIGVDTAGLARQKIEDVNSSIEVSDKKYLLIEREAYYLEDKPVQALWQLKKYCF